MFGDTRISLKYGVEEVKGSLHAKIQLDPSIRFNRTSTCDKQTDGHRTRDKPHVPRRHSVEWVKTKTYLLSPGLGRLLDMHNQ